MKISCGFLIGARGAVTTTPNPTSPYPGFHTRQVMRKYHLQNREDYTKYNRMCGHIKNMAARIRDLDPKSPCRAESSAALLQKLYNLGEFAVFGTFFSF